MATYYNYKDIKKGMLLAEDLTNKYGQTLAKAGSVINDIHLKMFMTWSIDGVMVKEKNEIEQELGIEEKAKYLEKVYDKLRFRPKNKVEQDLAESILSFYLKYKKVEINR